MEQKIQAKFDLLPKYKQDEILGRLKLDRKASQSRVIAAIQNKLPVFDNNFNIETDFKSLLYDPSNWLFLPFIWDAIDYYFYPQTKQRAREVFANEIVALLRSNKDHNNELSKNLLYANFSHINLSDVYIWSGDLTGANLSWAISIKNAKLNNCTADGVDFRLIVDLDINQLINLGSLYKTKFDLVGWQFGGPVGEKTRTPEVQALEERIVISYREALYNLYTPEAERTITDEQTKREQIIDPLLQLIQLSGFAPVSWGINNKEFHDKFDALYKNHAQVLTVLKQKIHDVVKTGTGTYYTDRLNTKDWKAFWKPEPCASRGSQINKLHLVNFADSTLGDVVLMLGSIKAEIKKEWNIWDSELLKKINEVVNNTINETVNPSASSVSSSKTY